MEESKRKEIFKMRHNRLYVGAVYKPSLTQGISKNNKSGVKGVSWDNKRLKWVASICLNYKQKLLGRFNSFEEAVECRKNAEEMYFKPFLI